MLSALRSHLVAMGIDLVLSIPHRAEVDFHCNAAFDYVTVKKERCVHSLFIIE